MGCFYVGAILLLSLFFFWQGHVIAGCGCVFCAYVALMIYNRLHGDGKPTFTFEECKEEWEEQERGK